MSTFKVKILEENGDIDIYSEATACTILGQNVVVLYGEKDYATHTLEVIDEITIKKNR